VAAERWAESYCNPYLEMMLGGHPHSPEAVPSWPQRLPCTSETQEPPQTPPNSQNRQKIDILTDRPNTARGKRIVRHEWLNLRIVTVRTGNLRVTERRGQLRSIDKIVLVSFV
jgi:hypothetical protein